MCSFYSIALSSHVFTVTLILSVHLAPFCLLWYTSHDILSYMWSHYVFILYTSRHIYLFYILLLLLVPNNILNSLLFVPNNKLTCKPYDIIYFAWFWRCELQHNMCVWHSLDIKSKTDNEANCSCYTCWLYNSVQHFATVGVILKIYIFCDVLSCIMFLIGSEHMHMH